MLNSYDISKQCLSPAGKVPLVYNVVLALTWTGKVLFTMVGAGNGIDIKLTIEH